MKRFSLILAAFLAVAAVPVPLWAEAPAYEVAMDKSTLKFYAIQKNLPVQGQFKSFTADIRFDAANLAESKISVEVDMASLIAGEEVMKYITAPEWLDVGKFQKASFVSKSITRMPYTNKYYSEGELTLRGKTQPLTLNFEIDDSKKPALIAKGFATISRNNFGIGQGEWAKDDVVKNEVRAEFRIVAFKK